MLAIPLVLGEAVRGLAGFWRAESASTAALWGRGRSFLCPLQCGERVRSRAVAGRVTAAGRDVNVHGPDTGHGSSEAGCGDEERDASSAEWHAGSGWAGLLPGFPLQDHSISRRGTSAARRWGNEIRYVEGRVRRPRAPASLGQLSV